MNDTSSKYDKWIYEPKLESCEEFSFMPVDGINPIEWSNISSMARAICHLVFVDCCLCKGVHTKEGHFERHISDAKKDLCEALAEAVIEVDERRKHRMAHGYSEGGQIKRDMAKGMSDEDATLKSAEDACKKMGIGTAKKGGAKCRK